MAEPAGRTSAILARVEKRLRSEEARALFRALLQAQERAGARDIKEVMTRVLKEEIAVRAQDAEVGGGDGQ